MVQLVKNPPAIAGHAEGTVSNPGSGRSPRKGNGNPLQYSCLENAMDRGAWWATAHGVSKSRTQLSRHTRTQGWKFLLVLLFWFSHIDSLLCKEEQGYCLIFCFKLADIILGKCKEVVEAPLSCGESCFHLSTLPEEARLVAGTACSIKKQMAHKKLFRQFHLLATKALKLWLWTGASTTKWSNQFTSEVKVQMRVIPKSDKWFPGHPQGD